MTTTTCRTDCDVLVVGSGPTGLTLAVQLLARGVRVRIIDKDRGTPRLSRAIGIAPRTLETLDMMGMADRFLAEGHPVRGVAVYAGTRRVLGIDMALCGSPYRFQLHLPQHRTEALLRERLTELGGAVEGGVELVSLTDAGGTVTATVVDAAGHEEQIVAGFLVGCDGAHSRVRHQLGVPFEGQPYPWDWLLADAHVDWPGRRDEVATFTRPAGLPLLCVPITDSLLRLSLPMPGDRGGKPPTLEEIQTLVDERGPGHMQVVDAETLTCFRCQIRSTSVYRRGRVLLAGDAVHIHSPAGGQGMNTGMADATNLGWKLALVVHRRASDGLLDTYGAERQPVAAHVLRFTEQVVRFAIAAPSWRRTLRNASLPALRLPPVQRRLARRMSQTAVSYAAGPLTRPGHARGFPKPGERMPDLGLETVRGPSTVSEELRKGRHLLIGPAHSTGGMDLGPDRGLVEVADARPGTGRAVALVRPDGYLAVVTRGDLGPVRDYLQELAPATARPHLLTAEGTSRPQETPAGVTGLGQEAQGTVLARIEG